MMDMYDTHCVLSDSNVVFNKDKNQTEKAMIYGWICPVCGKGISPYISYCNCKFNEYSTPTCNSNSNSTSTSTTTLR